MTQLLARPRIPLPRAGWRLPPRSPQRAARAVGIAAGLVGLAVAGMLFGLRMAGDTTHRTAIGTVSFAISPSIHGRVDAYIPVADWGVRAHAFRAPLEVHVEPRRVNRRAVLAAAGGDGSVLAEAERDARSAARHALPRAYRWVIGGALALGLVAALALAHRPGVRRRLVLATAITPALCAAALGGLVLLRIAATFDSASFQHPRFYARGAELEQLLKVADNAQREASGYTSQVQRAIGSFAALVATGARFSHTPPPTRSVTLASDLHDNLLALRAVQRQFADRPILFPGDFGQTGSGAEAKLIVKRFRHLHQTIVAVSGNHDSALLMRRLAGTGVIVLTDTGRLSASGRTDGKPVQDVLGMRVAGWPDPLEASAADANDPRRIYSFAERPDAHAEYAAAERRLREWFNGLPERPDAVLLHQNGLAQSLARTLQAQGYDRPLLILTGHDHVQHVDRYGHILVVDGGTVGAGGLFGAGKTPVSFANLNLAGGGRVGSVDLVRVQPFTGAAQADRTVLSAPHPCRIQQLLRCHEPSPVSGSG